MTPCLKGPGVDISVVSTAAAFVRAAQQPVPELPASGARRPALTAGLAVRVGPSGPGSAATYDGTMIHEIKALARSSVATLIYIMAPKSIIFLIVTAFVLTTRYGDFRRMFTA